MNITFRPIVADDFEFLWRLHNAALKEYVEQTWGWNEAWQRKDFESKFNPNDGEIMVINGTDAGYLWTVEKETEVLLASIRLLPEFQRRGIGAKIIADLLNQTQKPVRLQVLKINPARALYERLGFEIVGETETHFTMRTK